MKPATVKAHCRNIESLKNTAEVSLGWGRMPSHISSKVVRVWMEASTTTDDVLLLTQIAQRNQAALSLFYDRYSRIVYALAFKSLRSVEESEEVVLDVFAQVWRIAERYDARKGKVDTWLFTLVRSRILDRLRKLQRTTPSSLISFDAVEIEPKADCIEPFEEALMVERRSQVQQVLQTLPEAQRLVLQLAYYQGLTQSEIAAQTGLALGTVKTRIRLGLSKLKSTLGSREDL